VLHDTSPFCELPYRCLTKLLENVYPEIDRNGYYHYNNDQDDEQRRYLCSSASDDIKNNSICDGNDDRSDNKSSRKDVEHGFTPYASVLIFDSKLVSAVA
jgi:hypothetical protein